MINRIGMGYSAVRFSAGKPPLKKVVDAAKDAVEKPKKELTTYEKAVLANIECDKNPSKTEEILTKIFGRPPVKI